ncbi:MAG TPA: aspartate aminotransferase family protein [Streptosporangiaceae bacterium]
MDTESLTMPRRIRPAGDHDAREAPRRAAELARLRDRRHVWHTWSPVAADRGRLMISHGYGYRVQDMDGKEYIDAKSLNTTCGYGHPDVERAVRGQLRTLHQFDISTAGHELAGLLAERIASYLPGMPAKTLFVNSGSEGFEAAVLIAASYWSQRGAPRSRIVSFADGYQGATLTSRSLSGLPRVRHPFRPPLPVTHVRLPAAPRELRRAESLPPLLAAFERAIGTDPDDLPMAVVVEPLLNVGGGVVLPPGFLRALRGLCDATGTLLILDEVFTGYGRTGRMFACGHEDVLPDILVSSKGLSGGYVPIGAVTVREEIYDSFRDEPDIGGLRYGHTTSGHPVACAAALATLDVVEKEDLVDRAGRLGALMLDRLSPLAGTGEVVDVRGLGLVVVLEMSGGEAAELVLARAEDMGLLLRRQGARGQAVLVVPPMTIDDEGAAAIIERVEQSVAAATS